MPDTTQSTTKSSDNGSMQQTVPGGITFSPYISWSNHYFCSLQGILRIIEIILVLIALIVLRVVVICSKGIFIMWDTYLCSDF